MFTLFNLILIALALLITYWWANQGLFSSFLHFLSVLTAAAVALAFWEIITVKLLLRGSWFDDYAWGVCLIMLFSITLVALRVVLDKIIPSNVELPNWANLTFGGLFGAASAVLTLGILIIGAGFLKSDDSIAAYKGYGRARNGTIGLRERELWAPFHVWTSQTLEFLSVYALRPDISGEPLRHYSPELYKQASLVRDGFNDSKGQLVSKISVPPDAVQIRRVLVCDDLHRVGIALTVSRDAFDFGQQFTLSNAQIRLIGQPKSTTGSPTIVYPDKWTQNIDQSEKRSFAFDDYTYYATSFGGQNAVDLFIEFPIDRGQDMNTAARFLQIKNTRFSLPAQQQVAVVVYQQASVAQRKLAEHEKRRVEANNRIMTVGTLPTDDIYVGKNIQGMNVTANDLPAGLHENEDGYIIQGDDIIRYDVESRGGSWKLRIKGLHQAAGRRILQVNVSRGATADFSTTWIRSEKYNDQLPVLVDADGNGYEPLGYVLREPNKDLHIRFSYEQRDQLRGMSDIPTLAVGSEQELRLIYAPTIGVRILGMAIRDDSQSGRDKTIATCDFVVEPDTSAF